MDDEFVEIEEDIYQKMPKNKNTTGCLLWFIIIVVAALVLSGDDNQQACNRWEKNWFGTYVLQECR